MSPDFPSLQVRGFFCWVLFLTLSSQLFLYAFVLSVSGQAKKVWRFWEDKDTGPGQSGSL